MQIGINYVTNLFVNYGDYTANVKVNSYEEGKLSVLDLNASDSNGLKYDTFGVFAFNDPYGNRWVIGQQTLTVTSPEGEDLRPDTRHYEYNDIGDQVQVLNPDKCGVTAAGDKVYINKNDITIVYANGSSETILRYHTMIFQKTFAGINGMRIVDAYPLSDEEHDALVNDPSKHLLTLQITDSEGAVRDYRFYQVTARKAYVTVNGVGGFYVQTTKVQKVINDLARFFAMEDVDMDAID